MRVFHSVRSGQNVFEAEKSVLSVSTTKQDTAIAVVIDTA